MNHHQRSLEIVVLFLVKFHLVHITPIDFKEILLSFNSSFYSTLQRRSTTLMSYKLNAQQTLKVTLTLFVLYYDVDVSWCVAAFFRLAIDENQAYKPHQTSCIKPFLFRPTYLKATYRQSFVSFGPFPSYLDMLCPIEFPIS